MTPRDVWGQCDVFNQSAPLLELPSIKGSIKGSTPAASLSSHLEITAVRLHFLRACHSSCPLCCRGAGDAEAAGFRPAAGEALPQQLREALEVPLEIRLTAA